MIKTTAITQVETVCRQQITGMLTKNLVLLDQIIAPTAIFTHLTGEQQTKADWLRQIKIGRMHYFNSTEEQLRVTLCGDHAEAIMRDLIDARIYGFRNTWAVEAKMTLTKTGDQWQISQSQAKLY